MLLIMLNLNILEDVISVLIKPCRVKGHRSDYSMENMTIERYFSKLDVIYGFNSSLI